MSLIVAVLIDLLYVFINREWSFGPFLLVSPHPTNAGIEVRLQVTSRSWPRWRRWIPPVSGIDSLFCSLILIAYFLIAALTISGPDNRRSTIRVRR